MVERSYKRVLSYGQEEKGGRVGRSDKRMEISKTSGPFVAQDGITITTNDVSQAADFRVRMSSTACLVSELVKILKVSALEIFSLSCAR